MILDRIIQQELVEGQSIGTEAELLAIYGVSRPTLRESLRILEHQGVLRLRPGPGGGTIVTKPSIDLLAHNLSVYLLMNGVPFSEILKARMAIEPTLVASAALQGTEEQFDAMDATIDRLEAAGDDGHIVYRENREFHNIIAKAAGNPVLEVFWQTIRALASGEGAGLKYSARNRANIVQAHRAIVAACRRRDAEAARRLITDHLGELDVLLRTRHKDQLRQPAGVALRSNPS